MTILNKIANIIAMFMIFLVDSLYVILPDFGSFEKIVVMNIMFTASMVYDILNHIKKHEF
jgi:hypothetical protein